MSGVIAATASYLIWAVAGSILLRSIALPGPMIACLGFLVGAVVMFILILKERAKEIRGAWREHWSLLLRLSVAFAGASICYQSAVKMTTIANATITQASQAIITCVVFMPLVLRKRPSAYGLVALAVGLLGLGVLLGPQLAIPDSLRGIWGIILGLASAAFFAWFNVLAPRMEGKMPHEVAIAFLLAFSFVISLPFALFSLGSTVSLNVAAVEWAICLGLANAVCILLYYYALQQTAMERVTALSYLEPPAAIGTAAIFLGEPIGAATIVGGIIVLAASALAVFGEKFKTLFHHR